MRKFSKIISFLFVAFFYSCEMDILLPEIPQDKIDNSIKGFKHLTEFQKKLINGVYIFSDGKNDFGDTAVVKFSGKNSLSIFVKKKQTYCVLYGGELKGIIRHAGYWRYSLNEKLGFIELEIDENTSTSILNDEMPTSITFNGKYEIDGEEKTITLTYLHQLKEPNYYIIAHRGGGRNIDRLPASENSIELIEFSEALGANGIEIDIQLTKDKVPVLFHDEYLSKRLINQDFFIGKISDYNYEFLDKFVTLKQNEHIPKLEDAFQSIIYNTTLQAIWLDIKTPEVVGIIAPLIVKYQLLAKEVNRDLEIYLGIPDESVLDAYLQLPNKNDLNALCELSTDLVQKSSAKVWAPRWSLGLLEDEIMQMHNNGIKVFTWTLDEELFIKKYIQNGNFDGILSNYPFLVAYEYYTN
ncbi:MAG: hypothetical protein A2X64_06675 [Ignavibacteria bacterium GWF2_33_9]|nr:MAG: hypothetical protein A2X64_06675 [Ignavibacteria bacterium GWF2_33_9]